MRGISLIVIASLLSPVVFAAVAETDGLMPLQLLESVRGGQAKLAEKGVEVTVGGLDEKLQHAPSGYLDRSPKELETPYRINYDGAATTTQALSNGSAKLMSPGADQLTVLWIKLALDDNYTYTVPTALSRRGNTITLELEHWYDTGPRDKSYPVQFQYLIPVGKLAAGNYELEVQIRSYQLNLKPSVEGTMRYQQQGTRQGKLPFVCGATAKADDNSTVTLKELPQIPGAPPIGWPFEIPRFALGSAPVQNHPNPGVYVGTLDVATWLNGTRQEAPKLSAPTPLDAVYAMVVGPEVSSGDSMRLSQMAWNKDTLTLVVEVWRDDRPRLRNVPSHPVLLLPLNLPGSTQAQKRLLDAGTYTVEVRWAMLRAKDAASPFNQDSDENIEKVRKLEHARTVTIGADPKLKAAAKASSDF